MSTGGGFALVLRLPGSSPLGNSEFMTSTATFLHSQCSLQLIVDKAESPTKL